MTNDFSVFLLGSTDLTLRVADVIRSLGLRVAAICHVDETFAISYSAGGVRNARHADIGGWCRDHDTIAVRYDGPDTLEALIDQVAPTFGLAAGWYHMVPRRVRERFPRGCAGLHASLLPALRGGAPLNWAILSGLDETGVSLFELSDGVDDGMLYGQASFPVGPRSMVGELVAASTEATETLLRDCLPGIAAGALAAAPQVGTPTYGMQRTPEDGVIDWRASADDIDRLVRAVSRPYPGAQTWLAGRSVSVWRTELGVPSDVIHGAPGQIACRGGPNDSVSVAVVTGNDLLWIHEATFDDGTDAMQELSASVQRRLARDGSRARDRA